MSGVSGPSSKRVLLKTNNLSDVSSAATSRSNLNLTGIYAGVGVYSSGNYYYINGPGNGATAGQPTAATLRLYPWAVNATVSLTRIGLEITLAGDAGSTVRIGIYADSNGVPGTLVLDAGTVPGDSVAVSEITISQTLTAGAYWVGYASQGVTVTAPTWRTYSQYNPAQILATGTIIPNPASLIYGYSLTSVSGALPGTFSGAAVTGSIPPRAFIKVA